MRKALLEKIAKFCDDRRRSEDGGWAEVRDGDLDALGRILYEIIEAKWQKDADGDVPINFRVVDRTRHFPLHYRPVRYDHVTRREREAYEREHGAPHPGRTTAELLDRLQEASFNLSVAWDEFGRMQRALKYHLEDEKE